MGMTDYAMKERESSTLLRCSGTIWRKTVLFGNGNTLFLLLTVRPIPDDKQPNLKVYNEELRRLYRPTWRNISWLYSECYLYRYTFPSEGLNFPDSFTPCLPLLNTGNAMTLSFGKKMNPSNLLKMTLSNSRNEFENISQLFPKAPTLSKRSSSLYLPGSPNRLLTSLCRKTWYSRVYGGIHAISLFRCKKIQVRKRPILRMKTKTS